LAWVAGVELAEKASPQSPGLGVGASVLEWKDPHRTVRSPVNLSAPQTVSAAKQRAVPLSDIGDQSWWTRDSLERLCRNRELASGLIELNLFGSRIAKCVLRF
jgi:hypothetical protein